ncbi:IscS subfamily cysteine desulfurase [Halothece sp. PCC 7418]|uniref:IscS subfamily cysteine desulfurase n=1 Tax=Halothece sp. (strain PCC 7418) TaxID=65093 RepID=UPI0012371AE8|nr:IscS subfamily cysteine desulfurase [Halothece sp. PCC 7418]
MMQRPIYLDCHATTPVDPQVLEAMLPYFTEHFGNPSSVSHAYGWEAEAGVKQAREMIAQAINASPEEIIFTSGATEANNLAIKGVAEAYFSQGQHIITVATEHRAVLDPCQYLESLGFEVTYLPVGEDGLIDLETLKETIREDTILVSVMAANNEIGVLQPIADIGEICRERGVLFHTDAAQALAKIPLDVEGMKIDLMSLTAHKLYGPKGIGALYVRRRQPKVRLASQIQGGGQERNFRSGTLYPPQIVGFGKAVELGLAEMDAEGERQSKLRDRAWEELSQLEGVYLNGHPTQRLPGNLNISVAGVDGTALILGLQPVIAVSSGSACSSQSTAPSHVITALGRGKALANASIRFGMGRFTTEEEIDSAIAHTKTTIESLQKAKV